MSLFPMCLLQIFPQLKTKTRPQFRSYSFFYFLIVSYNFTGPMNMGVISWNPCRHHVCSIFYIYIYKYADSISRVFSSSPSLSPWSHSTGTRGMVPLFNTCCLHFQSNVTIGTLLLISSCTHLFF